jgi:hypothetical protein
MALLLGILGGPGLSLALFFLYLHAHYPHIDCGNSMAFSSMMKGILGGEGLNPIDWLIVFGLQFGGALVGAIVWCLISGAASAPVAIYGDNDGRGIFLYLFASMVQSACFYYLGRGDQSQFGSFKVIAVYLVSWELSAKAFAGSVGGVSVDFGRMLGSKIIESGTTDMTKFWVLLVGGFAGMVAGPLVQKVDAMLRDKQGDDAGAADEAGAKDEPAGNEA